MNNAPKVSIIVPVYNVEKYIRRCLDSIQAQTFTNFECILIDDGSPDASGKICDEYAKKDSRFRVIHKENGGVSSARNVGLDVSKGEWVCFCDSDDWVEKDYFEKALAGYRTDSDIVKSGYRIISGNENKEILPKNLSYEQQVSIAHLGSFFIKKTYLLNYEILFPEGITLAEDWYFKYQLSLYNPKIILLNEITYNYLQNENSVMHTLSRKNIEDEINVIRKVIKSSVKNEELITAMTITCRSQILYCLQDFKLYRKTFPETFKEQFKRSSIKGKILLILIFLHLNLIVKALIRAKSKFF